MKLDELKRRLQTPVITVVTPSACGFTPAEDTALEDSKARGDVGEEVEDDEDDTDELLAALMLLAEAEDALYTIIKLDRKKNFLSINHAKDVVLLLNNMEEFTGQYETEK